MRGHGHFSEAEELAEPEEECVCGVEGTTQGGEGAREEGGSLYAKKAPIPCVCRCGEWHAMLKHHRDNPRE